VGTLLLNVGTLPGAAGRLAEAGAPPHLAAPVPARWACSLPDDAC
jgi:hypothetical protein